MNKQELEKQLATLNQVLSDEEVELERRKRWVEERGAVVKALNCQIEATQKALEATNNCKIPFKDKD